MSVMSGDQEQMPRSSVKGQRTWVSEYLSEIQTKLMEIPASADQLTDIGELVVN
jgi:hypothetical protein